MSLQQDAVRWGARNLIDIAAEAGVAVQTVYFTFTPRPSSCRPATSWPSSARMTRGRLPPSCGMRPCSRPSTVAPRSAASPRATRRSRPGSPCSTTSSARRPHEPDAAQVRARNERLRREGYTRIIGHLADQFGPPADLDPAEAVDILLTLAGPATYRSLVADYGWPHDRFVDWLADTLSQQLLPASQTAKRAERN